MLYVIKVLGLQSHIRLGRYLIIYSYDLNEVQVSYRITGDLGGYNTYRYLH